MSIRKRVAANREENQHESRFKIVGKMKKKSAMNVMSRNDVEYFNKPHMAEHIPGNEYVYLVIGPWDHVGCKICFPNSDKVIDNRKAPGS